MNLGWYLNNVLVFLHDCFWHSQGKHHGHHCTSAETFQDGQTSALDPERRRKNGKEFTDLWQKSDYKAALQHEETQTNADCGGFGFVVPTIPSMPCGSSSTMPFCRTHLAWPELMNWSMIHWAVLWKSPNWASHRTSALGLAMAKPNSKPAHGRGRTAQLQEEANSRARFWRNFLSVSDFVRPSHQAATRSALNLEGFIIYILLIFHTCLNLRFPFNFTSI